PLRTEPRPHAGPRPRADQLAGRGGGDHRRPDAPPDAGGDAPSRRDFRHGQGSRPADAHALRPDLFRQRRAGDRRPLRRAHRRPHPHPRRRRRAVRRVGDLMSKVIPLYPIDIFTPEAVRNAREVDDALREFAPVVRLADGTHMLGRHEHVSAGLLDWKAFSSTSRPWHDPTSPRPEILLTDDPPRHTPVRKVIADALSPRSLDRIRGIFEVRAQELLERLRAREGEAVDAVSEVTQAYVFQVLPDILGLPEDGREHMHGLSEMVSAPMGPPGELFGPPIQFDYSAGIEWSVTQAGRGALAPHGIGAEIYRAADRGQVTLPEAKLLLQTVLSAGADTTFITMANALRAWALFPGEYARLRAEPKKVRAAFDESLRWDSPSRMAGQIGRGAC